MRRTMIATVLLVAAGVLLLSGNALGHPHILAADNKREVTGEELLADLSQAQVVLIGELHNHVGHHQAQLAILDALRKRGKPMALGVEMFRQDSQKFLDRWTAGMLSADDFRTVFEDNWSMWREYLPVFDYVRDHSVKTVGLNIPRELTSKVARQGFAALEDEQRQALGNVVCVVDHAYSNYIRRAMGGHGREGRQYLLFCEAPLLWDTMMARNIIRFLAEYPEFSMVVIAGSAHAWKFGIPRQMLDQADISYRVVLPEIEGRIDRTNLSPELTDYLWLDYGDAGWHF